VFYAFGEPVWILALLFSGATDYIHGLIIDRHPKKWQAKAALISSLILNLGLLGTLKYSGFIVETLNSLTGLTFTVPHIALPLGISFYTFQTLSYTIDIYRGAVQCQRSLVAYMAYVTMFPQLVAGPIIRYADIQDMLITRTITLKGFSSGITRFTVGLGKKVLLANAAGRAVDMLFFENAKFTVLGSWLGVTFFAFQIYFDFSGYSDMAIGLGRMFGFNFKENFNYPYISGTVTEFWRRWHISLSSFFRDFVYIPLGGNRKRPVFNLLVVWFLTGLWHGANWNFILWGMYYGVLLIIEKYALVHVLKRIGMLRHVYSTLAMLVGWAIFFFTDLARLSAWFTAAVGGAPLMDYRVESVFFSNIFLLAVFIVGSTRLPALAAARIRRALPIFEPVGNAVLMVVCFIMLVGQTYNPFLYFRF
jgi:alginate O-acetyltransferase complex protein AlgI